ncbi:MAG: methyl-accepting chemotaxis protein [Oscillospiraceae bacterium]|nr:methyl-accepting chemotaxis protein [Oscillospiraceae bacterium]
MRNIGKNNHYSDDETLDRCVAHWISIKNKERRASNLMQVLPCASQIANNTDAPSGADWRKMKNLKVSTKLIIGFMTVAFFAVVVGIVGIAGMDYISKTDNYTAHFRTMTTITIVVLVIIVSASLFLALYISSLISKPILPLAAFMSKAGRTGDISLTPADMDTIGKYSGIKNEIGQAINGAALFVKHVATVSANLEAVANGDLTIDVEVLSDKDVMGLSVKQMINSLNDMFTEINQSTQQVSTGANQIADGAQVLAQGTTEQAASLEELSSSITEISEKTKDNAEMADEASKLSTTIKKDAEIGISQMDGMIEAVKDISDASHSIGNIIKTIDDIAFQTNILALNAAVEAARAGQHGKGFAVVAEEVRNLATKSARAAKDTSEIIQDTIEKSDLGSRIAGETAQSLHRIGTDISESNRLVAEIATASKEQSLNISQINIGINQVSQVVQQNSATAQQSAAASEEMSGQSAILKNMIMQFKLKDNPPEQILRLGSP